jgi:hypothetical protein
MKKILLAIFAISLISGSVFSEVIRKVTSRYSDDSLREVVYMFDNNIIAKETYEQSGRFTLTGGIPDGPVREYDKEGKLDREEIYSRNKRTGVIRFFDDNGKIKQEGTFSRGKGRECSKCIMRAGKSSRKQIIRTM